MISEQDKINAALDLAFKYGQIEGDHHRACTIDQIVRALIGSNQDYKDWIKNYCLDSYEWDEGIAP